jgi:hypothetical protein
VGSGFISLENRLVATRVSLLLVDGYLGFKEAGLLTAGGGSTEDVMHLPRAEVGWRT